MIRQEILRTDVRYARHNWNRWIVDCGRCTSALELPPMTPAAQCWDCGAYMGPIQWPEDWRTIEYILSLRPDPNTRNWEVNETVQDLLCENIAHGIVDPSWGLGEATHEKRLLLLGTRDGVATEGLLFDRALEYISRYELEGGNGVLVHPIDGGS